jgi:predicted enzyme related to lactoylglutathione lyase
VTDPLRVLVTPVEPVQPDPGFAAQLRARLARALDLPEGVPMSEPSPSVGVVPYLAVSNGREAIAWYTEALGAVESGDRYEEPDGRIGHAELRVGDAVFYLSDGAPELGVVPGDPDRPVTTSLVLTVPDTDSALRRARGAGARVEREPQDNPYGRIAVVRDPYGHRWMLEGPVSAPAYEQIRHGDIGYASWNTPDVERAVRFYGEVLGWEYAPGSAGAGRQVTGLSMSLGLWGGQPTSTLFCVYAVDDIDEAVRLVREAGGAAGEPERRPYGTVADCTDTEGVAFAVYQPVPGDDRRPPVNGQLAGDLAYVTRRVTASAPARAFYASVLGWRFIPAPEGWQVEGVAPMVGFHDGQERDVTVPMWRVDDIADTVARVRLAGGQASEPQREPYGLIATCTDDQGGEFHLGQL